MVVSIKEVVREGISRLLKFRSYPFKCQSNFSALDVCIELVVTPTQYDQLYSPGFLYLSFDARFNRSRIAIAMPFPAG